MTPEEREQVVELLRRAADIADIGHAVPLLAAAVASNKRHTPIWPYARDAVNAVVAGIVGDAKPDRVAYPGMLRTAAGLVEEGRWP